MKIYHAVHVVILWAIVISGALLPLVVKADACGVLGDSFLSLECTVGTHPEQIQKRQFYEQMEMQRKLLEEQRRQTRALEKGRSIDLYDYNRNYGEY